MHEMLIIIRREFLERVRSRAFLIGTLLFPVFIVALLLMPAVGSGGSTERTLVLVDEAPSPIGDRFVNLLTATSDSAMANTYTVERVAGTFDTNREALAARARAEEIDGWIVLPADILDSNTLVYRARNVANTNVLRDIRNAGSDAIQSERLRLAGLERDDVLELTRRITVDEASIAESGDGRGAAATFLYAYILAFLIYFITAFYGMNVLRSVLEEKTSRIAEVMISSVRAKDLMAGKIIGVGAAALLQVGIWVVFLALVTTQSDLISDRFGVPREVFAAMTIPAGQAILFVAYFALGFFLFASLFAAVGAAMTTEQEAQSLQFAILVPLFVPLIMSPAIAGEPLSTMATVLGLFPLTAPIAMPMRIASAPIPPLQIAASLILLVLGLMAIVALAGKIYRIGILSTGKRPSVGEVVRWLREA
jgi:ABC-2 type transport system permease protein